MKHVTFFILSAALLLSGCGGKTPPVKSEPFEVVMARAQTGDADAQFQVGASYHDGQDGVAKDLKAAKEWFEKAAAQGDERAQFNLGVMYYSAEGMPQNYSKAREWFEKAAAQKNARAQFNLGVMYYRGEGVEINFPQAIQYFGESGAQGFNEAQFNLGVMYAKGEGVDANIGKAYAWFSAAKAYGNERADAILQEIHDSLSKEERSIASDLAKELQDMIDKNVRELKKNALTGVK